MLNREAIIDYYEKIVPDQNEKAVGLGVDEITFILEKGDSSVGLDPVMFEFSIDFEDEDANLLDINEWEGSWYKKSVFAELPRGIESKYPSGAVNFKGLSEDIEQMFTRVVKGGEFKKSDDFCMMFTQVGVDWEVKLLPVDAKRSPQRLGVVDATDPECFLIYVKHLNHLQKKRLFGFKRLFIWIDPEEDDYFNIVFV